MDKIIKLKNGDFLCITKTNRADIPIILTFFKKDFSYVEIFKCKNYFMAKLKIAFNNRYNGDNSYNLYKKLMNLA